MHIRYLFLALAGLMVAGIVWMSFQDTDTPERRSRMVTAIFGFVGLTHLTQDLVLPVVFGRDLVMALFGALLVVGALIVPVFRAPEDQIGPHQRDLRK